MGWRKLLIIMGTTMAVAALFWVAQSSAQTLHSGSNGYLIPNYFGTTPNWANSPPLRKFVDTLPGLNSAAQNNLRQYIPVRDSRYGQPIRGPIIMRSSWENSRSRCTRTSRQRGCGATGRLNTADATVSQFQYLGPLIIAQKDRPVRILFTNNLPTGAGGNLFLPVDTTVMGSGPFEINYNPETKATDCSGYR